MFSFIMFSGISSVKKSLGCNCCSVIRVKKRLENIRRKIRLLNSCHCGQHKPHSQILIQTFSNSAENVQRPARLLLHKHRTHETSALTRQFVLQRTIFEHAVR